MANNNNSRPRPSRRLAWIALAAAVVAGILASLALWARGARGFSARAQPTGMETWMAHMMRAMAMPAGASARRDPYPGLTAAQMRFATEHFAAHCAVCHNNNGDGKTMLGENMYPHPPDLRGPGTRRKSDGALYYIIRNGIRMSGMPAWGDDTPKETWELVDFIRHLPRLTPAEIARMRKYNPKTIFPEPLMDATMSKMGGE